jgi:hypothetical protein
MTPDTDTVLGTPDVPWAPKSLTRVAVELARTEHRIRSLRCAALVGGAYDPREFDQAVSAARRLRNALRGASAAARTGAVKRQAA